MSGNQEAAIQAAMDRIGRSTRGAILRALQQEMGGFALSGHWRPEDLRVVYLFGKAYWWDRTPDGRLTLEQARWIREDAR